MDSQKNKKNELHLQRLQTLGMLAGGIAHDFNNILTGIFGHVAYLKAILPKEGEHSNSLDAIEEGAQKASLIVQQILLFSKLNTSTQLKRLELCDFVKRMTTLLRGAISAKYDLRFEVPDEPIWILTVEAYLAQILINLTINARDAILDKPQGHIFLALDKVGRKELEKVIETRTLKGNTAVDNCENYVRFSVADDGVGIPPEVLDRITERYFTTKGDKGSGIGLSTVTSLIKDLGGILTISSKEGMGTTVEVYLPLKEVAELQEEESSNDTKTITGSEKILVIDDESSVRDVIALGLKHLGYDVKTVSSGYDAIELVKKEKFDLVLLDMIMPQLSGEETFFKLKEIDEDIAVYIVSGFSSEDAIKNILRNGGVGFIQKPFTIDEIAYKVRNYFDA